MHLCEVLTFIRKSRFVPLDFRTPQFNTLFLITWFCLFLAYSLIDEYNIYCKVHINYKYVNFFKHLVPSLITRFFLFLLSWTMLPYNCTKTATTVRIWIWIRPSQNSTKNLRTSNSSTYTVNCIRLQSKATIIFSPPSKDAAAVVRIIRLFRFFGFIRICVGTFIYLPIFSLSFLPRIFDSLTNQNRASISYLFWFYFIFFFFVRSFFFHFGRYLQQGH